jgi:cyclic pyranopterin monophosphate synthase
MIMGAKKTADLVPLCHPLSLTHVEVDLVPIPDQGAAHCRYRPPDDLRHVQIGGNDDPGVRLLEKSGGRSGIWRRARGVSQRRRTARMWTLSGTV